MLLNAVIFALLPVLAVIPAQNASVRQIIYGEIPEGKPVVVSGTVVDAFPDETDDLFFHVFLYDEGELLDIVPRKDRYSWDFIRSLVNAKVRILRGTVYTQSTGIRRQSNPFLATIPGKSIQILDTARQDGFNAPPLERTARLGPLALKGMGRRKAHGRVLAVWQKRHALIQRENGLPLMIHLGYTAGIPAIGETIDVVGIVDTDSVNVLLTCAIWRKSDSVLPGDDIAPSTVSGDGIGPSMLAVTTHGKPVLMQGVVRYLDGITRTSDETLLVESSNKIFEIDPGPCQNLFAGVAIGSKIEATGILLAQIDPNSTSQPFTRFAGYKIVIRKPEDFRIVANPPWWTPARLLIVIIALVCVIGCIFGWNRILMRLINKRSRQLADEELANVKSELRLGERTALAVELHDSLSQTLTGAAMEIRAAEKAGRNAPPDLLAHLTTAGKTLQSCRDELKNCLWDLRSQALEYPDMTQAILRTLEPHINESRLSVRFNVPRILLTESATHAILCTVRELVLNAIRHGGAQTVKVAGCLDGDAISYSVTDNGSGFDPDTCPSVLQGHFGLQGIRERLRKFHGCLSIESKMGVGTKVSVQLKLRTEEISENE